MTISRRTFASWVDGQTSLSTNLPPGTAEGDLLVLFVGAKPYYATINTPSGWTAVGTQQANGTTANAEDAGSVTWAVFYKIAGASESAPTVSVTSGNIAHATIQCLTKTKARWWPPTAYFGNDTSSGTSFSLTMSGSSGAITAGDYLLAHALIPGDNATFGTVAISASGATIGTVSKNPGGDHSSFLGQDIAGTCAGATVSSGTASADAVVSSTLSTVQTGGGSLVRIRETDEQLYYVIYTAEKGVPSAAQVKAGQDNTGSAAAKSGSAPAPTTTGAYDFPAVTGLSVATAYKVSFVWSNGTTDSSVATSATWATTNTGSFTGTEGGIDTATFQGMGDVSGSFAVTENVDTAAFTGDIYVRGSFTVTEGGVDSAAIAGDVYVRGNFAVTESGGDSVSFSASSSHTGSFAVVESPDTASISGKVYISGLFTATESGGDSAFISTSGGLTGSFAATEGGVDTAFITARGQVFSPDVAANNTWTPVAEVNSIWGKVAFAAKDWTREVR